MRWLTDDELIAMSIDTGRCDGSCRIGGNCPANRPAPHLAPAEAATDIGADDMRTLPLLPRLALALRRWWRG